MTPVTRRQVESGEAFVSRNQASPEDELLREVQVNVTRMSSNDTEQEEREPDQTEQRERQRRFIANHSGVRGQYRMSPYPQRSTPSKYRSILGNPPAETVTAGPSREFFAQVPPPAADGRIPTFGCGLDRDPTCDMNNAPNILPDTDSENEAVQTDNSCRFVPSRERRESPRPAPRSRPAVAPSPAKDERSSRVRQQRSLSQHPLLQDPDSGMQDPIRTNSGTRRQQPRPTSNAQQQNQQQPNLGSHRDRRAESSQRYHSQQRRYQPYPDYYQQYEIQAPRQKPNFGTMLYPAPFGGTPDESFRLFQVQLRAAMEFEPFDAATKMAFLTLKLKGDALTAFDQLDVPENQDPFEYAMGQLKRTFGENESKAYADRFTLGQRKFRRGKETIDAYVTQLKKLAKSAYRPPDDVDNPERAKARADRVCETFIAGMSGKLKRECMMLPHEDQYNIEILKNHVAKILLIDEYVPEEDVPAFNAMYPGLDEEAILRILTDIKAAQGAIQNQSSKTTEALDSLQKKVEIESTERRNDVEENRNYKRNKDALRKQAPKPFKQNWNYQPQQMMQQQGGQFTQAPMVQQPMIQQPPIQQQMPPMTQATMAHPQQNVQYVPGYTATAQPMQGHPAQLRPQAPNFQPGYSQNRQRKYRPRQQNDESQYGAGFQRTEAAFCRWCGNMGHQVSECRKRIAEKGSKEAASGNVVQKNE